MKKSLLPVLLVILADHGTKRLAEGLTAPVPLLPGVLGLRYARNTGVAFSLLSDTPVLSIALSAVLILLFPLFRKWLKPARLASAGLSLMLGGAVANLAERLAHGYVTDMVELLFVRFPVFNLADACLTVGCALTVLGLLWPAEKKEKG